MNEAKIAAIGKFIFSFKIIAGVHISRGVTSHGVALNCNTDLNWFNHIVPCGIPDKSVTSISKELNGIVFFIMLNTENVTINDVLPVFKRQFRLEMKCDLIPFDENALFALED